MKQAHNHDVPALNKKLKLGLILNTSFTVIEFTIGLFSGSLALVSDSLHNLTDSLSLLITYFSARFGEREPDRRHSYGHERMTIIAALFNSTALVLLSFYIFYEAIRRILHPQPVEGLIVSFVAFLGILINGSIALLFFREKDLHVKSAFVSMAFDTIASVGALIAGIIIFLTKTTIADPIISIGIGLMLLFSAWGVIKESLHILLEGTPDGVNIHDVEK
ncbi:cation transporter, partial [Candidatus Roizmanbacteria bacterium CG02_land_8_20_14_3_00_36_15]